MQLLVDQQLSRQTVGSGINVVHMPVVHHLLPRVLPFISFEDQRVIGITCQLQST